MQISRHWRLNSQRYRLQGVRYTNGEVSLQERPKPIRLDDTTETPALQPKAEKVAVKV
jgi:hypothetical protein